MKLFQTIFGLLIFGASPFASGCGTAQISSGEKRALTIARDTLQEHHLRPDDFSPPKMHYDVNERCWHVTFWPKLRVIDGDVFVVVDDRTGEIISASRGLGPL